MQAADRRDLERDRSLLSEAVAAAAGTALELFKRGVKSWSKSDQTPITEADLAVNRELEQRLTSARPEYGWLSEETCDDVSRLTRRRCWIVDPIDGTKGFVRGNDQWCISAALVEDGRPVLGIIANPATAETFEALLGEGARLNGEILKIAKRRDVEGCRLVMHRSILGSRRWGKPWPEISLAMWNSMALRLCRVASGEADGAIVISRKSDWDLAAADLIVAEAGGRVTGLTGKAMRYNERETRHRGVVGAGQDLHGCLLEHTAGWTFED
ncbi:MAG: 3'(2'),5'-bisphosphate nucleotidase CysQ [Pseudomonadota bacterium]